MQLDITILKDEMSFFERYAKGEFELTQSDKEDLCIFSMRVAKLAKTEKFNQALVELNNTFENEFKDGCHEIACTDCVLNDGIHDCYFRRFGLSLLKIV